jgi:hypothetical protein
MSTCDDASASCAEQLQVRTMSAMSALDELAAWVSESLLHHMLYMTTDVVVALDADNCAIFVSQAAVALGWDRAAMIGREWPHPMPTEAVPRGSAAFPLVIDPPEQGRISITLGDGTEESVVATRYRERRSGLVAASLLVLRRDDPISGVDDPAEGRDGP